MKLSVVLPVLDEEKNIAAVYKGLNQTLESLKKSYEIIFVDDGSTDSSFNEMEKLRKKDKKVRVIKLRKNFGQSAALQAGFDYARGDVVIAMDSDLQNDPRDIPKLLHKLETGDYDCVSGWRKHREDSFQKSLFSAIASLIRRPFLGSNVHDFGCTLKAYKQECLKDLNLTGEMHRYIPPLLRWRGYKVGEMVVRHRPRRNGTTKYGMARIAKGFLDMLNVWFWQKFSGRPLHIFGGLGLVLIAFGAAGGFYSIYMWFFHNMDLSSHFISIASFLAFILGVQFFVSGIIADVGIKGYHAATSQKPYNVKEVLG